AFFKNSKYPILPNVDSEEWQEAVHYFRDIVIPKRFSVLSGEIVHHLRSCFDHIAWHFSSSQYRIEAENVIEFPVFREDPVSKDKIRRFERKIKGIARPTVISLIRDMQPYKSGSDPENDPLCIIHDMDRFDKHRELAIVVSCANLVIQPGIAIEAVRAVTKHSQGEALTVAELALAQRTVNQDAIVSPQVAFSQIGKRKDQFVVSVLSQLHEAAFKRIDLFASLI
ncbi:MAG: hypothetical protein M3R43_05665, partial [Acidobacteriota bacterium]|nr:hypothetical protein [Acidobacteriota bacterium]